MESLKTERKSSGTYLSSSIRRMNEDSSRRAEEWFAEKRRVWILGVLAGSAGAFFFRYFLKGGFLRGWKGFEEAFDTSLFDLVTYAKYWELCEKAKGRM